MDEREKQPARRLNVVLPEGTWQMIEASKAKRGSTNTALTIKAFADSDFIDTVYEEGQEIAVYDPETKIAQRVVWVGDPARPYGGKPK